MVLTRNCKHIAHAKNQGKPAEISLDYGYVSPILCTPNELMGDSSMWNDEIVEEIHQIREHYAKSFNYDLKAIFQDLRKKEAESSREVVTLSRQPGLKTRWSGQDLFPGEAIRLNGPATVDLHRVNNRSTDRYNVSILARRGRFRVRL